MVELVSLALQTLAHQLAMAADGLGLLSGALLGGLFIRTAKLHFTKMPSRCIFFFSALSA